MSGKAGFSLIEALMALVIASISLTALFELQHELVNAQKLHEKTIRQAQVRQNALALFSDLNLDVSPSGEIDLPPNLKVNWSSTPITNQTQSAGFPAGAGTYFVTLYSVAVEVDGADGQPVDQFKIERMGWTSRANQNVGSTGSTG
jgi:prepilin-type N-terminal cleavage/methylation domain-containing protein